MTTLREIEAAALQLSDQERLQLATTLLGTVPSAGGAADADEILREALRRDAELETGAAKPLAEREFWAGVRRARP